MKSKILIAVSFVLFFCFDSSVNAQQSDRCGTKTPPLPYLLDSATKAHARTMASTPIMIKLFVHIIANNDGSGRAVADTTILRQMVNMQNFYAPHGICFMVMGIEQINSTDLNTQDHSNEKDELSTHLVPGTLNIFVHQTLFNDDGSLNGVAFDIPSTALSVASSAMADIDNRSTLAHEVGHCFGLYHTFATGYGVENIDRTGECLNCFQAGDLLCDTEADPHSDNNDTGNSIDSDCIYTPNSFSQYCDGKRIFYRMDPHNVMAYGRRPCRDVFTNGQGSRARGTIEQYLPLTLTIASESSISFTSNSSYSSGRPLFAAKGAITINSNAFVVINSARAVFASKNLVDVKGNVQFLPTGSGYTDIKAAALCQ